MILPGQSNTIQNARFREVNGRPVLITFERFRHRQPTRLHSANGSLIHFTHELCPQTRCIIDFPDAFVWMRMKGKNLSHASIENAMNSLYRLPIECNTDQK
jgi:hypothetical protein